MQKNNAPIRFSTVLAVALFVVLLGSSGHAQQDDGPPMYDYTGKWDLKQANGFVVTMELQQNGREITGKASYDAGRKGIARGTVQGRAWLFKFSSAWGVVQWDKFEVEITWHDGVGVYQGSMGISKKIGGEFGNYIELGEGTTWPKGNPAGSVAWTAPTFPLAPPPPPLKSSRDFILKDKLSMPKLPSNGQRKIEPPPSLPGGSGPVSGPPDSSPPPPMKVPGIVASQMVFPGGRFQPAGFVVLTWDGGPDHPYAEVWVKVDGGDETFVVEQGKGGLQVTVVRGRSYEYILTDAGKTLSTVSFIVPSH
jgi:hypothetical protein